MTDVRALWNPRCLLATLTVVLATGPALAETYNGAAVPIGHGTAHTVVRTDSDGKLESIGAIFTPEVLEGLPSAAEGAATDFAYLLPMPVDGPKTIVNHVVIDWEAAGHPPPHVYDVPHFDFHFYLVSEADHQSITFKDANASGDPGQQPPAGLLPTRYIVPPGTAVPHMGVHAVNPAAPEFQGQPFTTTFIYGYYDGQQTFFEPMASLAFLQSKPAFSATVTRPSSYSRPGAYPSAYNIRYEAGQNVYEVALSDFK